MVDDETHKQIIAGHDDRVVVSGPGMLSGLIQTSVLSQRRMAEFDPRRTRPRLSPDFANVPGDPGQEN